MTREAQLKQLRHALDAQRYAHTLGVEETAVAMAVRFGVDVDRAARAGRLHDCAKCLKPEEMLALVCQSGEEPDALTCASKALLHAPAGAQLAKTAYEEADEAVLHAIRFHTTGCAQMSMLDKIIYLADMIEPNRKPYPELETLRALCAQDLDEAMRAALRQSQEYVKARSQQLHPDTQSALDALLHKKEEQK